MSDAYYECMVQRKTPGYMIFLKIVLIILTVLSGLLSFVGLPIMIFLAAAFGVGIYFTVTYSDVEFEYLYLDKEITVDRVFHKSRRNRVKVYELDKIEIMAPLKSWHLDSYKNRTFKLVDLSSGVEEMPEKRYTFYYNGEEHVIFEPDDHFIKMVKNAAPRKVFTD